MSENDRYRELILFRSIDRLYAVSGKNGKRRAVGFTFSAHPESFGDLIATWEPKDVRSMFSIYFQRNEFSQQ